MTVELAIWKEPKTVSSDRISLNKYHLMSLWFVTFALEALSEESSQQPFAVLAHCWSCVWMDSKRVRHLDLAHQDFIKVNRSTRVEASGVTRGSRLAKKGRGLEVKCNIQQNHLSLTLAQKTNFKTCECVLTFAIIVFFISVDSLRQ